ncbi:OmpA family protein [Sphingomonas sp. MG17]|uniref:OmpA family protein n=1 Tax=Sphingomonas tagetis TaxID=2949092 RepID=A0A9X2HPP4_9SPHN|nr:OmpA family protein [Sphingomonas tagetis]MCP3729705.1 OmpA family protein [Sphingomonas tagetis]
MKKLLLTATLGIAMIAPASAQDWDWSGGRPGSRDYRLAGAGVRLLHPQLSRTNRGRAFVMRNFDRNRDGLVSPREADAANRAFERFAGPRRDRFDWESRDSGWQRPGPRAGGWDRGAMRAYGFRQTERGATMRMEDSVLFATDSAVLRPGASAKLETLAAYLRDNPGVRVAIEGHTDSRGTDAHNDALSLRRADAVRAAFDEMGVTRARFTVRGLGESQPIASNDTPQGMRQNRRVEVTLLGRRASEF